MCVRAWIKTCRIVCKAYFMDRVLHCVCRWVCVRETERSANTHCQSQWPLKEIPCRSCLPALPCLLSHPLQPSSSAWTQSEHIACAQWIARCGTLSEPTLCLTLRFAFSGHSRKQNGVDFSKVAPCLPAARALRVSHTFLGALHGRCVRMCVNVTD